MCLHPWLGSILHQHTSTTAQGANGRQGVEDSFELAQQQWGRNPSRRCVAAAAQGKDQVSESVGYPRF